MSSLLSTRVLRDLSKDRKIIVDGGCGSGIQALYLAGLDHRREVYAYDKSPSQIEKADKYKEERKITNASFSVATHDSYKFPHGVDMIYTMSSLIGDGEIPFDARNPLSAVEDLVERRIRRFREALSESGLYVFSWAGSERTNNELIGIAEDCGFRYLSGVRPKNSVTIPFGEFSLEEAVETVLVFMKR